MSIQISQGNNARMPGSVEISKTRNSSTNISIQAHSRLLSPKGGGALSQVTEGELAAFLANDFKQLGLGKSKKPPQKTETPKTRRTASDEQEVESLALEFAEEMPDFLDQHRTRNFLDDLSEMLSSEDDSYDENALIELASRHYSDVSYQHSALKLARKYLRDKVKAQKLLLLAGAEEKLLEEKGTEIKAGRCAHAVSKKFPTLGSPQELADFYRNQILGTRNPKDIFLAAISNGGEKQFDDNLDFFLEALGRDIAQSSHSIDPAALKTMVNDIYLVIAVGNVRKFLAKGIAQVEHLSGEEVCLSSIELLKRIIDYSQNGTAASENMDNLAIEAGLRALASRVYFYKEIVDILAMIPDRFFYPNESSRELLQSTAQQILDFVTEEEEKEEEE